MPRVKKDERSCILLRLNGERDSRFPNIDHSDPINGLCSGCKVHQTALKGTPLVCLRIQEAESMENAQKSANLLAPTKRSSKAPTLFECDPKSIRVQRTGSRNSSTGSIPKTNHRVKNPQDYLRCLMTATDTTVPAVLINNNGTFRAEQRTDLGPRRTQMLRSVAIAAWSATSKLITPQNPKLATEALQEILDNDKRKMLVEAQQRLKAHHPEVGEISQEEITKIQMAAHQVLGQGFISFLKNMSPGKARRPHLAIATQSMTRKSCSLSLGKMISEREWRAAVMHARYPGPGAPVPVTVHSKLKVKKTVLDDLLRRLQNPDVFQRFAFGQKIEKLLNGNICELDAVKLVKPLQDIIFEYLHSLSTDAALILDEICVPVEGERCIHVSKEYKLRCFLHQNHSGSHKYTPPSGISPSTLRRIISSLSAGEIKNLAGLDDEDVIKGYKNFIRIREIAKAVFKLLGLPSEELEDFLAKISDVEVFHKTKFARHASDEAIHSCGCIKCGFHRQDDPVPCVKRELGNHPGPCQDCKNSFQLFAILEAKIDLVAALDHLTPMEQDNIDELSGDLADCKLYLHHYRSHIILKATESKADDEMLLSMQDDEVTITCDWKMKILPMFFRENMQAFFGKRGTSCIGFMLVSNSDTPDMKNVRFHFFLTDDTTQDAFSVLTAKHILYSNLLPEHINKVHYKSDGAGCFSSNTSKAAMPLWENWTGVKEVSYRVSVSGGGKSTLDGLFGKLSFVLKRAADRGENFFDAKSIAEAAESDGGINACSFHVYLPIRNDDWTTKVDFLKQYTKIALLDNGDFAGFFHSQYGSGSVILAADINSKWVRGAIPPPPEYSWEQFSSEEKTTDTLHSLKKSQVRKEEHRQQQLSESRQKLDEKWQSEIDSKMKAGLCPCTAVNSTGAHCRMVYSSKVWLEKHIEKNVHCFSSLNSRDYAVAFMSEPGSMLSPGSNPDRAFWTAAEIETVLCDEAEGEQDWYSLGCYNKHGRKQPFMKTAALKADLERMYEYGLIHGKTKYTPSSALQELKAMRDPLDPTRLKYSRRSGNVNGPIPTEEIIKQWFAIQSSNKKKAQQASLQPIQAGEITEMEASNPIAYAKMTIRDLKEILKNRKLPVSGKNKAELVARLVANDDVEELANRIESISLGRFDHQAAQP